MSDNLDPKELKVLGDILALVLEDQPGQASSALDALRARARRNKMTGGALKNLFTAIAPNPPTRAAPRARASTRAGATSAETQQARAQVRDLTESLTKLDMELRTCRADNSALRAELFLTQQARAETQTQLSSMQSAGQLRLTLLIVTFIIGAVAGVAGGELFHALRPAPTHTPNAVYLR
ncbi:hypothetical protein AA23498_1729 [Acetobacter nitrogenifigens DSM 23921 = NBRC 105050]|uniref:Uncharacterized protein n=2 Tax=Acetobacter TaxID=434 RepID=A0A511X9D9_9PROT|nr:MULTISPECIES: hypothetical protein [Acetobacter]MBO1360041.1 hypothetical protein [Acetobacter sacchari]GBQ93445.1 hypothetical protein AA23498_1729 [Acetobacter nitrogenifigens DSM 23921 = NBRC 105050]GEN59567.1 hypothetical protein ANI02nite_14510 [Acetobacter nitrogenifigens DSM 23921 = NBRC 105050]